MNSSSIYLYKRQIKQNKEKLIYQILNILNICECENDRKILNKQIFINILFWRKSDDDLKMMIFVLNFIFEELVAVFQSFWVAYNEISILKLF